MRADRLIQLMFLLQNNGKMTTFELAKMLEVSERTILRDMDALSLAGIPVVAERGKTGGWKLMDHFRSAITGIHLEDLKSLFILPSEKILEQLGINTNATDLRQKLMASMPHAVKDDAQQLLEKIYIDTGTWKPAAENPSAVLNAVQMSLWKDRKLIMKYQKTNGDASHRRVCPLGLVFKGNSWYLVALTEEGEYRNFKLSRISEVEMLSEGFAKPKDFRLSEYWKQSKIDFARSLPQVEVKVLAHSSIVGRMTFTDKFVQKVHTGTDAEDQMVQVVLHFNSEQEAVEYVLGFGNRMRLLQPEHFIPKIVEQAESVIRMYKDGND